MPRNRTRSGVSVLYKIMTALLYISLAGSLLFAGLAVHEYLPVYSSDRKIEELKKDAVAEPGKDPLKRSVDFAWLRSVNPDIIGWLYIPGTTIDFPILKGKTDTEYLWKGPDKNYSPVGSLFTFADEPGDMSGANPYIFGHTLPMFDMFGELRMYQEEAEYRKTRNTAYIYTPSASYEVQLYSVFRCRYDDRVFTHNMGLNSSEYSSRIREYKKRNEHPDIPKIEEGWDWASAQTFSLSSCHGSVGTPYRLVTNWINTRIEYKIENKLLD